MYRAVLFVVIVATVWADEDKCRKAHGPPGMHCCMERPRPPPAVLEKEGELKECLEIEDRPPTCAREMCIADKRGYHAGNGDADKGAFEAMVKKDFADEPELQEKIIKKCINGDLSTYGPPDMCELMKMTHCGHFQVLAAKCPEWSDKGECSGMKELIKECS